VVKDEGDLIKAFDANGNLQQLQPGQALTWDLRNQLRQVIPVERAEAANDDEVYVYDGGGQRLRKIRSTQARNVMHRAEVRYLPGLELRTNTATGETLQVISVSAGRSGVRVLHWEPGQGQPEGMANDQIRYSLSDHLGSSSLELDQQARLISQEGYYPYGGTAWWTGRNATEASYKTIRYSGKERDATGLYYYGFRYYAPWLDRWINPDPAGDVDGLNLYRMARNNPVTLKDVMGLSPDDEVYHNYVAIQKTSTILYETRQEAAQFLSSKRATISYGIFAAIVREAAANIGSLGGAMIGTLVAPGPGTIVGGLVGKEGTKKIFPSYNFVPDTNMAKKIEAASQSTSKKIKSSLSHTFSIKNITKTVSEKGTDKTLNYVLGAGVESVANTTLPVSVPFVGIFKGVKELNHAKKTTKQDLIQELILAIDAADATIEKIDSGIRAGFKAYGREINYPRDIFNVNTIFDPSTTREFGVRVESGTHLKTWVRASRYEHYYAKAKTELAELKALVNTHSQNFKYKTLGKTTAV
jgi:insecticidal toxin complex protein TccC